MTEQTERMAEVMDEIRIVRRAEPRARTGADGIDSAVRYVRSHTVREMRDDLEARIRQRPLTAIAVAFLAGYVARRIS